MIFVSVLLGSPAQAAQDQNATKTPRPVGAVNSSNGSVYQKGEYGIILKYFRYKQDQLYDGSDEVDFVRPKKGAKPAKKCSERKVDMYQVTLRAGIFENIDARLVIPFLSKEMTRQSFNSDFTDSNSGIGDISLISRYRDFVSKKKRPV